MLLVLVSLVTGVVLTKGEAQCGSKDSQEDEGTTTPKELTAAVKFLCVASPARLGNRPTHIPFF